MNDVAVPDLAALVPSTAPVSVVLTVSDPEVLLALAEYPEGPARDHFLATALKVGVLSLRAARGTLDTDSLRKEGDRLVEQLGSELGSWRATLENQVSGSLAHYFDPQQGTFMERVHRLTKADGELVTVIRQQMAQAESTLGSVFERFIGQNSQLLRMLDPGGDNQLVAALQRVLDGAVQTQNQAILGQFSLDNKSGALARFLGELTTKHGDLNQALQRDMQAIVAEFSLDKEDSALSRLVSRVEAAQSSLTAELSLDNQDSALHRLHRMLVDHQQAMLQKQTELATRLDAAIQSMTARRDEDRRSTRHGNEFEETLGNHLRQLTEAAGDILRETGTTTGFTPNCKVGDYVITIGPEKTAAGAQIVVEAKENAAYDLVRTLDEAQVARINRQANVCVFVHSTKTAPATIPDFRRYGHDLVVRWDPDDDALDVWLQAALMVATALSVKASSHGKSEAASFDKIDKAIERIRKAIEGFDEINTAANTSKNAAEKILNRARLMQEGLPAHLQTIFDEVVKLKEASAKG